MPRGLARIKCGRLHRLRLLKLLLLGRVALGFGGTKRERHDVQCAHCAGVVVGSKILAITREPHGLDRFDNYFSDRTVEPIEDQIVVAGGHLLVVDVH